MALINRITRLFRADMHAVLDRLEEPDSLLRQAVREMEEEIAQDRKRLKLWQHEKSQLGEMQSDLTCSIKEIDEELDLCFNANKEELALGLVRRKLEAQRFVKFLSRKAEALDTTLSDLQQRLEQNESRLHSMQQKLELLNEELTSGSHEDKWLTPDIVVRDEEVEVAFLREQQQRVPS